MRALIVTALVCTGLLWLLCLAAACSVADSEGDGEGVLPGIQAVVFA
jgi:hypothetical protein